MRCKRKWKLQFAYRAISDNDPLVLRHSIEKKTPLNERYKKKSVRSLSRCSPSDGVLLREITVQRATYVINGENDDTRSTRWKEATVEATPAVMPEHACLSSEELFLFLMRALDNGERKHSRINCTYPFRTFPQLIYTVTHSTCAHVALHEKLREAATRARRPSLLNVFPSLFFLNRAHRFSFFVTWEKKGQVGTRGAKMRTKVASGAVAMYKFSPRSRAYATDWKKTERRLQESKKANTAECVEEACFLTSLSDLVLSCARGLRCRQNQGKGNRVREGEGKRNVLEWCEVRIVSFGMPCHLPRGFRALLAPARFLSLRTYYSKRETRSSTFKAIAPVLACVSCSSIIQFLLIL